MASIHFYDTKAGDRRYAVRFREGGQQRSRSFHRKRDALAFQADEIRRRQLGELWQDDGGTLGQFLEGWLVRYSLRVRPSTATRRRAALRALPGGLKVRPLARLTAAEVEDAVTDIALRAPRQAELALASLKLALKDAAKRSIRFDRRILELASPRARSRQPRFLTWDEVEQLASWMPNDSYNRLVRVCALTGLRRGEVLALTWADVDLDARKLSVREGKTDAARRTVDLSLRTARLLRVQKGRHKSPRRAAPIFPNNRGGHHDPHNWYSRVFKPAARAAGFPTLTLHSLRHTYISLMAAAGAHPSVIAAQVGHKDGGSLVLNRYRHLFPNEGREAADKLEGYIRKGTT